MRTAAAAARTVARPLAEAAAAIAIATAARASDVSEWVARSRGVDGQVLQEALEPEHRGGLLDRLHRCGWPAVVHQLGSGEQLCASLASADVAYVRLEHASWLLVAGLVPERDHDGLEGQLGLVALGLHVDVSAMAEWRAQ